MNAAGGQDGEQVPWDEARKVARSVVAGGAAMTAAHYDHVRLAAVAEQRAKGWPDFHPETFCHRCGRRNVCWYAPPDVWNDVMRDGDPAGWGDWQEIICPSCFTELAEASGVQAAWRITRDEYGTWLVAPATITEQVAAVATAALPLDLQPAGVGLRNPEDGSLTGYGGAIVEAIAPAIAAAIGRMRGAS